ncbi:MAG: hypothetical protein U1E76_27200 [Planctomycetota bacterium]
MPPRRSSGTFTADRRPALSSTNLQGQRVTLRRADPARPRDLFDVVGSWSRSPGEDSLVTFDRLPAGTYTVERPTLDPACRVSPDAPEPVVTRVVVTLREGESRTVDL